EAWDPGVRPLKLSDASVAAAYKAALSIARAMGWQIAAANAETHHIEATATSWWFGFKYDVAINIHPEGSGSVVDMRSESRQLLFDAGDNARRVVNYLNTLETRLQGQEP